MDEADVTEYPIVLRFSAEDHAIDQRIWSLCQSGAIRIDNQIKEIAQGASTRLLALRGIHRDDVCWKLLLSRLENKEVTDLGEVVHIAYLALGQTAGRKTKQMRKVWKHLSGLIEEKVREATEDEIVAVLKDCLWLNARDLNPDMVRIVINSPDPQKIIERIKDFHFGYTTFNGMIMDVERHLQEDKSHP